MREEPSSITLNQFEFQLLALFLERFIALRTVLCPLSYTDHSNTYLVDLNPKYWWAIPSAGLSVWRIPFYLQRFIISAVILNFVYLQSSSFLVVYGTLDLAKDFKIYPTQEYLNTFEKLLNSKCCCYILYSYLGCSTAVIVAVISGWTC